jgi:uncharacterized membrane protein YkvI
MWFGFGAFSIHALLVFTILFSLLGLLAYLIGKWVAVLQSE